MLIQIKRNHRRVRKTAKRQKVVQQKRKRQAQQQLKRKK